MQVVLIYKSDVSIGNVYIVVNQHPNDPIHGEEAECDCGYDFFALKTLFLKFDLLIMFEGSLFKDESFREICLKWNMFKIVCYKKIS